MKPGLYAHLHPNKRHDFSLGLGKLIGRVGRLDVLFSVGPSGCRTRGPGSHDEARLSEQTLTTGLGQSRKGNVMEGLETAPAIESFTTCGPAATAEASQNTTYH